MRDSRSSMTPSELRFWTFYAGATWLVGGGLGLLTGLTGSHFLMNVFGLLLVLFVVVYPIGAAIGTARVAASKGHTGCSWVLAGFFFNLLALSYALWLLEPES